MIAALAVTAFALDCSEVVHMGEAGVPNAQILNELKRSVTPIDTQFVSCLVAWEADPEIVREAWKLHRMHGKLETPLSFSHSVIEPSWIELDMACGSVQIEGSDVNELGIEGVGQEGARLVTAFSENGARIQVSGPGIIHSSKDPAALPRFDAEAVSKNRTEVRPCADLVVSLPADTRVVLKSVRADVRVRHVGGPLELTTHFGDMEIIGATEELVLRTTNGDIFADTAAKQVNVESVAGRVEIGLGAGARVTAKTISGPLWFWGGSVERLYASAVSGDIHVNIAIEDAGDVSLSTHKGKIEARVPKGQVSVSSREGLAFGPNRKVRPNGPSQRIQSRAVQVGRPDGFGQLETLGAGARGVWGGLHPSRWWFRAGALLSPEISMVESGYTMKASSFSGDVRVWTAEKFPGPSGPIIAVLDGASEHFQACADAQRERHPGVEGHAVLTLVVDERGEAVAVDAPATSDSPEVVADGRFTSCVMEGVEGLVFPEGARTEVRWPVPFRDPVKIEPIERPRPDWRP